MRYGGLFVCDQTVRRNVGSIKNSKAIPVTGRGVL
jgi:hypothetical protein